MEHNNKDKDKQVKRPKNTAKYLASLLKKGQIPKTHGGEILLYSRCEPSFRTEKSKVDTGEQKKGNS